MRSPKVPSAADIPPPAPPPPMLQSPQGLDAAAGARRRAASSMGYGATILTGPQGLQQPATTNQRTLLGG